jgi:hypothetical protein
LAPSARRSSAATDGSDTPAYSIMLRLANDRPVRRPVDEQMRNLERLAGWDRYDDEPPPVVNFAANVPHDQDDAPGNEWVVESLEWEEDESSDRGTLLWQKATIVVGLYVETHVKGLGRMQSFPRRELKVGWDLRDFARRHLGDAKRWRDVADLNRDNPRCPSTPSFKPKRAVWLLVPPREPKAKKAKPKRATHGSS